jgi:hypothetical protein
MFRVLYCNIGAKGQPDRTSTVSTNVDAVKLLELLEKHSERRICIMSVHLERSPLDVQSLITSPKFK